MITICPKNNVDIRETVLFKLDQILRKYNITCTYDWELKYVKKELDEIREFIRKIQ